MTKCGQRSCLVVLLALLCVVGRVPVVDQSKGASAMEVETVSPSSAAAAVIAQVETLRAAGQFAEAHAVLEAALNQQATPETQRQLRLALAQMHRSWGESLEKRYVHEEAITQYEAALAFYRETQQRKDEAAVLTALGEIAYFINNYDQANDYYANALTIQREIGDHLGEATTLDHLARLLSDLGRREQARETLEQALAIQHEQRDRRGQGWTLELLSEVSLAFLQNEDAGNFAQNALAIAREVKDQEWEGRALAALGVAHRELHDYEQARTLLEQALAIQRKVQDRRGEAETLGSLARLSKAVGQHSQATERFEQALVIAREVDNRAGEMRFIFGLADVTRDLGQYDKAIAYAEQALAIARQIKNPLEEGVNLLQIGLVYQVSGQQEKAIEYYEPALAIMRELKHTDLERLTLNALGLAYLLLGQMEKATAYSTQSQAIPGQGNDKQQESLRLTVLGRTAFSLGRYEEAVIQFEAALALTRELHDRKQEGILLSALGEMYRNLSQYDKALAYHQHALAIARQEHNRFAEGLALNNLAAVYTALGQNDKTIESFEQALVIMRELKRRSEEISIVNNLGQLYNNQGQYEKARTYFAQALVGARDLKLRVVEGTILNNLSQTAGALGQYEKALVYAEQALAIAREVQNRAFEGMSLNNLGKFHEALKHYDQASDDLGQALGIVREVKDRAGEGTVLGNLMGLWKAQAKPRLAIFYGKQAVNVYQEIRGEIQGLDKDLQQSFVHLHENDYRMLADLLIAEGRLPEAQQVLDMLKAEEYFDFVRREAKAAEGMKGSTTLTPPEAEWARRYREIADRVTALGVERQALKEKEKRTPVEEQQLTKLEDDLGVAKLAFKQFLDQLKTEFSNIPEAGKAIAELDEKTQGLMPDLRELGQGVVALYTLVGAQTYRVLLITSDARVAREYPIAAADLNHKVQAFRDVLQQPQRDPRPLAQELYEILVGPVARDLEQAQAQTLMWALDGALRYAPIAALYDGERYLVERYQNVVFTPASLTRLKDLPQRQWTGLGLGVSLAYEDFVPLPAVGPELHLIIREPRGDADGVLRGAIQMDKDFTEASMRSALRQRYGAVHIASHFKLTPGNDTASFLLLGDGSHLSLARLDTLPNVFEGVELLTLSACNTAMGGAEADGKEIEGFGVMAQKQGAKAVLATLWSVADQSTQELMVAFYRAREAKKGMAKVEALRQAQLTLLHGTHKANTMDRQRGAVVIPRDSTSIDGQNVTAPQFHKDPAAPYAHPYYWAPFILIGNWR